MKELHTERTKGLEEYFVIRNNQKLRFGYTTGSCAAAAAQAAARMLFSGENVPAVRLTTPAGITLFLETEEAEWDRERACCAVRKDAGDDPDVTDGILVYAEVRRCGREEAEFSGLMQNAASEDAENLCPGEEQAGDRRTGTGAADHSGRKTTGDGNQEEWDAKQAQLRPAIWIRGGRGIGTVTLPGLDQPVGEAAINRVPRRMIEKELCAICEEYGYARGLEVTISAPAGEKLADKTFNPRLGIVGGISILGTTGIVRPMSEQALVDTIRVEMRQKTRKKKFLLVTPGNYGTEYIGGHFPFPPDEAVKCSNYVGQTIDLAVDMELSGLLFVAHIGKFVKVAGGIMNTHSREADCRMEILASCALRAGADADTARRILETVTCDAAFTVISEAGLRQPVSEILMKKIDSCLNHRAQNRLVIGAIVFSNVFGEIGRTAAVPQLLAQLLAEKPKE